MKKILISSLITFFLTFGAIAGTDGEKKLSNKAKFVEKSKKINTVTNNNDSVAKLVALLKELFFENNPYIKHATARIAKVTSGTKRICIKLFSICRLIVRYN